MGGVALALVGGIASGVAAYLVLQAAARDDARVRRALGLAAEPPPPGTGPSLAAGLAALGWRVPAGAFDPLGGAPRFGRAVPDDERERWRALARGVGSLLALAILVTAVAWSAFALLLLFAVPWLSRLVIERELRAEERRRRHEIGRDVTPALDVLVLALEAGLPFERAVGAYADASDSRLAAELRGAVRELEVGYRRREVLDRLVARTRSPALEQLARGVRLAEDFGTPLASGLRSLAVDMRAERRQRLQEAALRAPVTMLFPTAAFILVPIFAIVLGPIVIRIVTGSLF